VEFELPDNSRVDGYLKGPCNRESIPTTKSIQTTEQLDWWIALIADGALTSGVNVDLYHWF